MPRILVADDETAIRELVQEVLRTQGWTVDIAANGNEALAALRQAAYDLLILDRNMPDLSGIETLTVLRSEPRWNGLKVVMLTGASVMSEIDEALRAGADDYLMKPLNLKTIIEKVSQALASGPRKA